MTSERAQRLALNEALFRAANERMAGWEESRGDHPDLYHCECADLECREKVPLTKADYERIRRNSCHFFLVPGHETPDVETVIDAREDWLVVEKDPEVREIVEAADRRQP